MSRFGDFRSLCTTGCGRECRYSIPRAASSACGQGRSRAELKKPSRTDWAAQGPLPNTFSTLASETVWYASIRRLPCTPATEANTRCFPRTMVRQRCQVSVAAAAGSRRPLASKSTRLPRSQYSAGGPGGWGQTNGSVTGHRRSSHAQCGACCGACAVRWAGTPARSSRLRGTHPL